MIKSKINRFCLIVFFLGVTINTFSQKTERYYLSGIDSKYTVDWDFFCTEGNNSGVWTKIPVPSNWELQGFGNYNYGNDWRSEDENIKIGNEHGIYKFNFDVPRAWKGKTVKIVFDGSMTDTKVMINGKLAGAVHQGGFNRFSYDITKLLAYKKSNLLEVDVAKRSSNNSVNKAEREADYWIFGGIYRPVYLEILPEQHIKRVAIDSKADGSFEVVAQLNSKKLSGEIKVTLSDVNGKVLAGEYQSKIKKGNEKISVTGKFDGIKSWNPESPKLYDMQVALVKNGKILHKEIKRIGFRTVELREHDGFYVNNKKVIFKGVNRHSFWPETGRALNDGNHKLDITLMKDMHMNAVRMSHYAPDERFLTLCDSLGLFVLDELAGWQDGYDTKIGPKLIKELILKDENHPSVIIWGNGNEGGYELANEKWFDYYDLQKRPVIYPWLLRNGVDTHHYNSYDFGMNRFSNGNDVFMPTELLHGLYDGGHGAGLYDMWQKFRTNPRAAGGFLWVFSDEAVLRTDKQGKVYDSNGNQGPDGILGPHREKEGSFYTVKELWSPVQIAPVVINSKWDGKLFLNNDYIYTNINTCDFEWKVIGTGFSKNNYEKILAKGNIAGPDIAPGETRSISIPIINKLNDADIFSLTARDQYEKEIYTWSWQVQQPKVIVNRYLKEKVSGENKELKVHKLDNQLYVETDKVVFTFDLDNGKLIKTRNSNGEVSFSGGPTPIGLAHKIKKVTWDLDKDKNVLLEIISENYPEKFYWKVHTSGLLELEVAANVSRLRDIEMFGISFNYPEDKVKSMTWFGKGPYRVWKNRLHGVNTGVWEKEYNNTITGESFNDLIYPEFKGYHANMNWVQFNTTESPFTILIESPNIFMQIFTPDKPKEIHGDVYPVFPKGDISFLYEIPAIGTKFTNAKDLGPTGQKGQDKHHKNDDAYPLRVWFDFR